ncbi:hypothetical protein NLG97_g8454 [Lecanicillium saksenae]|uniref:Uncharacterized protein n=1 Tax=Lecanicillium saksenae TaxID=468837 RepID=A0ACC1QL98_9HYPO|nr:hypothetical protein NLG97_g8454 [Lecanicillium saksenae]
MPSKKLSKLLGKVAIRSRSRPSTADSEATTAVASLAEAASEKVDPPKLRSWLMDMPVEVVLEIAKHLHHRQRVILSLTCSPMKSMLNVRPVAKKDESYPRYIKYLYYLARDLPDRWVCEECVALHTVNFGDLPSNMTDINCNKALEWLLFSNLDFIYNDYQLGQRHVQLTLKYSRMRNLPEVYADHLKALLSNYEGTACFSESEPGGTQGKRVISGSHSVQTKVVGARFLALSTLTFDGQEQKPSMRSLGCSPAPA